MTERVDEVLGLFRRRGQEAYFGENVSELEHALQAAELAQKAGSRSSLVLAALLHDIGHLIHGLPENIAEKGLNGLHEEVGYAWVSKRFGPEIAEPVRLHVAAKRYLCCREPEYMAHLSPMSLRSLELQGGPFSAAEAAEFETQPYFRDAVAIRRWDDMAKVAGSNPPGLEHYRDLIASAPPT